MIQPPDSRFPKKIRNSIILSFMGSVVIMLSLFSWLIYFFTKQHLENEMGRRLVSIGTMTAAEVTSWVIPRLSPEGENSRTFQLLKSKLLKATQTGQVSRVYLADLRDHALVDTDPSVRMGMPYFEHQLYAREILKAKGGRASATKLFRSKDRRIHKLAFVPIYLGSEVIALLGVEASADFFGNLKDLRNYLMIAVLVISLLIVGVGMVISNRLIHPINELVQAAKVIGTGDLTSTIALPHKNEFGRLAEAIDSMRLRLLEKESRMRSMLQGIAHEIRNPLGGIELFAGLLKEDIDKKNVEQLASVKKIQQEVDNLKVTVEQFLDFARDPFPQIEPVEAGAFYQDLLDSMRLAAQDRGIELVGSLDPQITTIWCDRRLMKAAIINILQNSLQAIGDRPSLAGGRLELTFRREETTSAPGLNISVIDNGPGIDPKNLANIFQPFFTTKERGCGLGLAFCEKIVHSHGGTIEVDSIPGQGTRMSVKLSSK